MTHAMPERGLKSIVVRESDRTQSEQGHILRVIEGIQPSNRIVLAKRVPWLAAAWIVVSIGYSAVSEPRHKRYIERLKGSGFDAGYSTEEVEDSQDGIGGRSRST